jgi:hypothetical protein
MLVYLVELDGNETDEQPIDPGAFPPGRDYGAEGEEMSAPGPAWSAEEEDLLRSLAAAGESAAAIATLHASVLTYSRSSWHVRRQGRSRSGNDPTRHESA